MIVVFFNDTATTEIYTLSLHDALPISATNVANGTSPVGTGLPPLGYFHNPPSPQASHTLEPWCAMRHGYARSEEHTSELQSRQYLVCRLLLEKKKKIKSKHC